MSASENVTLAAVQCALGGTVEENVAKVEALVREAARRGATVILPPELFEGPYFCTRESDEFFAWAKPAEGHPTIARFSALARELGVAIPVSFFERAGPAHYNSLAMVDADGTVMGIYRKSHIPDGPGYEEKFYFRPGDTGFLAWRTKSAPPRRRASAGTSGFPRPRARCSSRAPTSCSTPPRSGPSPRTRPSTRGTSGSGRCSGTPCRNVVPVVAANRVGNEGGQVFYGSSFIANQRGEKLAELSRDEEGVAVATVDLAAVRRERASWGFFRDRRPELYRALTRPTIRAEG